MRSRGALIVMEGLDHSGKSSQARLLAQAIPGAQLANFPDRTTAVGGLIDQYLRNQVDKDDRAIHLLFSANRWERISSIRAQLEAGTTVILDRYAFSGCVYSAAKGLPLSWCRAPDAGLIQPDLVVYLRMSATQVAERSGFGSERYEETSFQEKVGKLFDEVLLPLEYCLTLDAGEEIGKLAEVIRRKAQEVADSAKYTPLGEL